MCDVLNSPPVIVIWKDAANHMNIIGKLENEAILMENTTIGWKVYSDKERTILVYGTSTSGENDCYVIPTDAIVKEIPLQIVEKVDCKEKNSSSGHIEILEC